ncbi:transposase [Actinomadura sp. NAK00032]|uniref:IS110 family transposase n=1 Tax=Actinomadura sp. NAK00032 TaxID=2742128 RepID=UPI00267670E5|nr:transposase [Actinomadura sp. NAK00032]
MPGRTEHRMLGAYQGKAKTDVCDAYVVAETFRLRRDFTTIDVPAYLVADLALLPRPRRPGR